MTTRELVFHRGDAAEYTGRVLQIHGGTFYEARLIEGHRKGELIVTQQGPGMPDYRVTRAFVDGK